MLRDHGSTALEHGGIAQYSVSQRSGNESIRLTLWQPKDGSPGMLSLHVSSGASRYEVDTVKGGAKRDIKGSRGRDLVL
jgi:hypothetical protein